MMVVLLVCAVFGTSAAGVRAAPDPSLAVIRLPYRSVAAWADPALEQTMLVLVNRDRRAAGVRPLVMHGLLRSAARDHGRELFASGLLSHPSRDGRGPLERIDRTGLVVRRVGENVAYADDVRTAHRRLMASPAHRRNILSSAYGRIGIGVLNGGAAGVIVVEDFSD